MADFLYFDDDDDFLQVANLPCFCPTVIINGREKIVKVHDEKPSQEGCKQESLYLDAGGCPNFTVDLAVRELIQNLIDGAVDMNGDSHQGFRISRGCLYPRSKKGERVRYNATIIHNGVVKFAEFHQSISQMYFINFGNLIPSKAALLAFGRSSKRDKLSQAGKHGEGMKIAFMRFLQYNSEVEVFACIPSEDGLINEYNRFRIELIRQGRDAGMLTFKHSKRVPNHKPGAPLHFMISISTTAIEERIDIYDSILVPRQDLLTVIDYDDPGNLILDPGCRGNIYVKHVFVSGYEEIGFRFSYDIFHIHVDRSREGLDWYKMISAIAKIWDKNMAEHGRLFFDTFIADNAPHRLIEVQAIKNLSPASKEILANFLRNGDVAIRLITQEDSSKFKLYFGGKSLVVNRNAEDLISNSLEKDIEKHRHRLVPADRTDIEMAATMSAIFKPLKIDFCNVDDCPIRLNHDPGLTKFIINLNTFDDKSPRAIIQYITLSVLPTIQEYRPYEFFNYLVPEAPIAQRRHVEPEQEEAVEEEAYDEFEDDAEELPVIVIEPLNKRHVPFQIPDGYEWSQEWIVKKRKVDQ